MGTQHTDRELLELAARADGADDDWGYCAEQGAMCLYDSEFNRFCSDVRWNPLTDDGDALRLAVKLGLIVNTPSPIGTEAKVKFYDIEISQPVNGCKFAATRRAIVRAAAEIGKGSP